VIGLPVLTLLALLPFLSWEYSWRLIVVGLVALLLRFQDISFQDILISPSFGLVISSLFLFDLPNSVLVLALSLSGIFLFQNSTKLSFEEIMLSWIREIAGFLGAGLLYSFFFSPNLLGYSLSSYSLKLLLAVTITSLGYLALFLFSAFLIAFLTSSDRKATLHQRLSPFFLGLFLIIWLAILLLVPTYTTLGPLGFILAIMPLSIFFFAVRLYQQTEESYRQSLRTLVTVIEATDPYTHGHSDRVAYVACEIGKRAGLGSSRLRLLEYGAYLHDLGKVSIDPSILKKPGELNEKEWEAIHTHPQEAVTLLKDVKFLKPVLPWIEYHHERADGKGYPQNLPLKDIPLEARIITVADAFDAMISSRPYRPALSLEETAKELQKNAGQQFDPMVINILKSLLKRKEFIKGLGMRKQ